MSETIRIGLVGLGDVTGMRAGLTHLRGSKPGRLSRPQPRAGGRRPSRWGPGSLGSYDAVLDDPRSSGWTLRAQRPASPLCRAGRGEGKHVLCEKPIALTWDDAQAMVNACRTAGVRLMIAHVQRFWPEYVRLRALLRSEAAVTLPGDHDAARDALPLVLGAGRSGWRYRPSRMGASCSTCRLRPRLPLLDVRHAGASLLRGPRDDDGGLNHAYTTLLWPSGLRALGRGSYLLQGDPMIFTAKAVCSLRVVRLWDEPAAVRHA